MPLQSLWLAIDTASVTVGQVLMGSAVVVLAYGWVRSWLSGREARRELALHEWIRERSGREWELAVESRDLPSETPAAPAVLRLPRSGNFNHEGDTERG